MTYNDVDDVWWRLMMFRSPAPLLQQQQHFRSKTEKVNTVIDFYIFELVYVSSFTLNWQFWFFKPNLPKKGISGRKYHITRCYSTCTQIKKDLTIYDTARPRGNIVNENPMALLGQIRDNWPSMAPPGHTELTKMR